MSTTFATEKDVSNELPTPERCTEVAEFLKNLAHPQRLMILCLLSKGPMNVTELTEKIGASQSGVSQFLTRMKLAGLIEGERDGKTVVYRIASNDVERLLTSLHDIFC